MKRYKQRDIESIGDLYVNHIDAMTGEQLHSKSAIAAELAFRDARIRELETAANRRHVHLSVEQLDLLADFVHLGDGCPYERDEILTIVQADQPMRIHDEDDGKVYGHKLVAYFDECPDDGAFTLDEPSPLRAKEQVGLDDE